MKSCKVLHVLHAEVFAQIDLANIFIIDDLVWRARGQHLTGIDDGGAITDA